MHFKTSIALVVIIAGLASCGKSKQQIEQEARQREAAQRVEAERKQAEAEQKAIAEKTQRFKDQLLSSLRDPSSAQLRNLRIERGEGGEALCGEINAKNAYGGYVGFQPFAVTEKKMANTESNVIILSGGDHWIVSEANKLRLKSAGCGAE